MIKYLASDFDGTLYRNNQISVQDIKSLEKFQSENNKLILATGRSISSVKPILDSYSIKFDYLVLCNGAMILDNNYKKVSKNIITNETRKSIINNFYTIGDALIYYDNGNGVKTIENKNVDTTKMKGDFLNNGTNIVRLEEALEENCDCEIMSIFSTNNSVENCERIKKLIIENYKDKIEAFRNDCFVDIVSKGCSKGNALLNILKEENSSPDSLYCVGDSANDITMFKITNNSYTFHDSEEMVKSYAEHLINSVHEILEQI